MGEDFTNKQVIVLDGGLAVELKLKNDPLWSSRILYESPESITNAHKNYIQNGANIITTASYQASIGGFQKYLGMNLEESKQLMKLSVQLAKNAVSESSSNFANDQKKIYIAGSVGPYGACLCDGSEYTGKYLEKMTHEELINWHRPRVQCLVEAGVDILALETIPGCKEMEALIALIKDFPDVKAWLSFSSRSNHQICNGDDIAASVNKCLKLASARQIVAVGVNCVPPQYVDSLLNDISSIDSTIPLIVYPNSGEIWNSKRGWSGDKTLLTHAYLESWMKRNIKIIGGCCQVTPDDISKLSKFVKNYNI